MDVNAADQFPRRQPCFWLVIELLAGNDMDVPPGRGQVEVAQQLACDGLLELS